MLFELWPGAFEWGKWDEIFSENFKLNIKKSENFTTIFGVLWKFRKNRWKWEFKRFSQTSTIKPYKNPQKSIKIKPSFLCSLISKQTRDAYGNP